MMENDERSKLLKSIRILHCADIHFDIPFTSLGSNKILPSIRRQDIRETFSNIISFAKENKSHLLLICGDFFEHEYTKKSFVGYANSKFNEIPNTKVLIIPGNHDAYCADSLYHTQKWSDNTYIFTSDKDYCELNDIGVRIYGAGIRGVIGEDVKSLPDNIDSSYINILMLHGTLDMNIGKKIYNHIRSAELDKLGFDYVALGHFHNKIEAAGKLNNIFNPGSPEPLGFDEMGEHGVFAGVITKQKNEPAKLDISFKRMNKREYKKINIKLEELLTEGQIIEKIEEEISCIDVANVLLQVILKGVINHGLKINIVTLESFLKEKVFFIKFKNDTSLIPDIKKTAEEEGLKGVFAQKILRLIDEAVDEEEKRIYERAFNYGIEALEEGRIII